MMIPFIKDTTDSRAYPALSIMFWCADFIENVANWLQWKTVHDLQT